MGTSRVKASVLAAELVGLPEQISHPRCMVDLCIHCERKLMVQKGNDSKPFK